MVLEHHAPITASPLRLRERAIPIPRHGEILIKVTACAICRTDLHLIEGELAARPLPIIPGHQFVGRVMAWGDGCAKPHPLGSRVGVAWLRRTCGVCRFCRNGRENLCEDALFTGYDADGGFAEYAVAPEAFVYAIPPDLSDTEATPLLCAGIIGYRALARAALPHGGKLGIWGFGSSAHVVLQLARRRGASVFVISREARHRSFALTLGAAWVGESGETPPEKLDSAIIFAPAGELVPEALLALDKGGTLSLAGIHMSPIPSLDYTHHLFYEKNVHSVTANTREDGRALLVEAHAMDLKPTVTPYRLEDANLALGDLKADRLNGTGVLMLA